MAGRGSKAGSHAIDDITEVKKGILKKIAETVDGKEMEHLSRAYQNLTDAEYGEIRNFEQMLFIQQQRQDQGQMTTATAGYLFSNAKGT